MRYITLLQSVIFIAMFCSNAMACPTCKDSLHSNGVAMGYAISILFMMGMPFLIVAFWAVLIYRLRKQAEVTAETSHSV